MLKTALGRLRANQSAVNQPTGLSQPSTTRQPTKTRGATIQPLTGKTTEAPVPPGPTSTAVDITQTVDTTAIVRTAVGLGSAEAASDRWLLPIHPSNPVLFPNLSGVWQHYDRFAIHHIHYRTVPTASMLAGGSVVVATLAPDQLKGLTFVLPSFVDLINFATSYVWPLASEAVSSVAHSILNRARDYLMSNDNTSLTTPGFIASAALNQ